MDLKRLNRRNWSCCCFSLPKLNLPLSHRARSRGAVQPEVDVFCSWLTGASEDDS